MRCHYCHSTKNLTRFSKLKNRYICRECNTKRCKAYRQRPNGRDAVRRAVKNYEGKNLIRKKAWGKVHNIKQKPCIQCGKLPVHKHHPDITKPLEVIFLCSLHHKQVHML